MKNKKPLANKVRELTPVQIKALKGFLNKTTLSSTATGASMHLTGRQRGGVHSSLVRNKFIEKLHKNTGSRTYTYKLTPEAEVERNEIMDVIKNIEKYF